MTKSNGEEPRMGGRMERLQQGVRKRTLLAKKKVQSLTKEDVKSYLFRNAFVLLTVTAVIVGESFVLNQQYKSLYPVWLGFMNAWGVLSDRLTVGSPTDRSGSPLHLKKLAFLSVLFVLFCFSPLQKQTNKQNHLLEAEHMATKKNC